MPGFWLNWALVALSLANTILLLWLGMTLWLNADRRSPGITIAALGFLLGGAFFISHAALLLSDSLTLTSSNTLWLTMGMAPAVALPYVWYVVLLWYSGYWAPARHELRRRHRTWLWFLSVVMAAGFVGLALLGIPYIPGLSGLTSLIWPWRELITTTVFGIPLVALGYSPYLLLCVLFSLDALRRPATTERMMGEAARDRARPWLVIASWLLLVVGLLVTAVIVWTVTNTRVGRGYYVLDQHALALIGGFDLVLSVLIGIVVILLGQAMTAYELFTGKVLPRKGLARQWKRAMTLAGGYGLVMGGALAWGIEPVYAVLLTALLMTAFFALLSWRSYAEWEHAMRQLRPFVASQRWYDALVDAAPDDEPVPDPLHALCENLLNTTVAYLVPAGPTAALVAPRSYPANRPCPGLGALAQTAGADTPLAVEVDPAQYGGATWAVLLWREHGVSGVLLFGPRRDDGLYTREEIEIARSAGERLIDTAASVALSQRLMRLQRERMAATQLLDQRTRRVLHDDVLPLIHTATLSLAAGAPSERAIQQLSSAHQEVSNLLRELPPTVTPEIARLGLLDALQKMVTVEFGAAFDEVVWHCDEAAAGRVKHMQPIAAETLFYAAREVVRNAARHARSAERPAPLRLEIDAAISGARLQISIRDNGAGLTGAPPTGHGLALHSTLMAIVGGTLSIESIPGQMTDVQLALPLAG